MGISGIFHVIKVMVLGIPVNIIDAGFDYIAAVYHFTPKYINRTISDCAGFNCTFEVQEVDTAWGFMTLLFTHWPILIIVGVGVMNALKAKSYCNAALALLWVLFPYPLLVLVFQITFLFYNTPEYEFWTVMFLALEAYGEASPQSGVQGYILLSDGERNFDNSVYLALLSSIFTVSKGSAELFTQADGDEEHREDLPLTSGHPWYKKLFISQLQYLPTFITSYIFRGVSTVVIFVFLKQFAFIHLAVSMLVVATITAKVSETGVLGGLFHSMAGVMVLAKYPASTRENEKKPMLYSSLAWLALNSTTLLLIAAMVAAGPESGVWLPHWYNQKKFPIMKELNYVYAGFNTLILIAVGIFSIVIFNAQVFSTDWESENAKSEERMEEEELPSEILIFN